jgi:hypothetical protein
MLAQDFENSIFQLSDEKIMTKMNFTFSLSLFLFFIISTQTYSQLMRKGPYLIYNGNENEMQVLWQTYSTDTCQIDWGTDTLYNLGSAQTFENGSDHQHTYTITDLAPFTKYYYRVLVNQEIHSSTFRSAPDSNATNLDFFAYGDTRSNPGAHDQVAAAIISTYNNEPDLQSLVIFGGDFVSNGDVESYWDSQFFDPTYTNIQEMLATVPYQSCMGNHEGSGGLFVKYFPYPFVAGRYWSFDYGPAHFAVVDQYTSYGPGSAQLTWLQNDLASTNKPWKFIYLHEPGWSAGGGHENNTSVQNYIQPLCLQYGVQILFAGHNHYYARAIVDNIQHITTGGGGAPLYQPNLNYPNIVAGASAFHFCKIEINNQILRFTAIKSTGEVIDTFTIVNSPTDIESERRQIVSNNYILDNAYPDPFNPTTTINYYVPEFSFVSIKVFDVLGNEVAILINENKTAGNYRVEFSAAGLPSGIYFYRLQSGSFVETKKMVLMK